MVLLMAVGFVAVVQVVIMRRAKMDGLVSPLSIAGFSALFYTVSVPVELYLRDATLLGFTRKHMFPETAERVVLMAILGFIGLAAGHALFARKSVTPDLSQARDGIARARGLALAFTLVGALALATVFRDNVVAAQDYLSNVAQTAVDAGGTGFFLVNRWTYLSYGVFAFLSIAASKRGVLKLFWLAPLVFWSIWSNDKDPLLVAVMAASAIVLFKGAERRPTPKASAVTLTIVLAIAVLGLGAAAYGTSRAGNEVNQAAVSGYFDEGVFTSIDPAGPSAVLALTLESRSGTVGIGNTVRGSFAWMPYIVRPFSVPEDLAVTFAKAHFPNWKPGYGFGYSPLAEGWQLAGIPGVFGLMFVAGAMLAFARNFLLVRQRKGGVVNALYVACYFVVVGYLAFTLMRGTLTSFISNGMTCLALVVLLTVTGAIIDFAKKPPESEKR